MNYLALTAILLLAGCESRPRSPREVPEEPRQCDVRILEHGERLLNGNVLNYSFILTTYKDAKQPPREFMVRYAGGSYCMIVKEQ